MAPSRHKIAKWVRRVGPLGLAGAVLVALLLGAYGSLAELSLLGTVLLAAVGILACALWFHLIKARTGASVEELPLLNERLVPKEAELGALLLVGAFALVEPFGREGNPVFPLMYLLMAFITSSAHVRVTGGLIGLAVVIESALHWTREGEGEGVGLLVLRLILLAAFALLPNFALAVEAAKMRLSGHREFKRREKARREDARLFRLSSAGAGRSAEEAADLAMWSSAAISELEQGVQNTLEVAALALGTRSLSVFLLDPDDERFLWLFAARPRVASRLRMKFDTKEGLLSVAAKRREPVRLCGELRGVTWNDDSTPIRSVLMVPLRDEHALEPSGRGRFRGLLVADRHEAHPFEDEDEALLQASSKELLRVMESEWVMLQIHKDRERARNTHLAIQEFNRSKTLAEVFETAIAEVRKILSENEKDLVAVTTAKADDKGRMVHTVERIRGPKGLERIEGKTFIGGGCMVSQAVNLQTTLPARPPQRSVKIFGEDTLIRGVNSLKVVPLKMGREVLGTLVFGTEQRDALDQADEETLELLASQVAQSLQRATFYAKVEALAQRDGLTGLVNRRVFSEKLEEKIALAKRNGSPVTVLIADIDHFKTVNDTYGHLTGDEILKKVGEILQRGARSTDVVARYGGEEFTLILADNDAAGGKVKAERIREEIEATTFTTALGPLRCTLSLGIASFPEVEEADLFEMADQALYHSKRMGRNRSSTVQEMKEEAASLLPKGERPA